MNSALLIAVIFSVLVFFLTSVAIFVTRKRNDRNAIVVVTSATHSAPGAHVVPQMATGTMAYQTRGIPTNTQLLTEQAQAPGFQLNAPAYSTIVSAACVNPPPYDVAVSYLNEKQSS